MNKVCVNIACGDSFIEDWKNFDFSPYSSYVTKANLLEQLPLIDNSSDTVYSSHFLEHIPHDLVISFLRECFRITKSGGKLRLVLPDLEELCSVYLSNRQSGEHEKADFLILEMIDQCVRSVPGGELGAYYLSLQSESEQNKEMIKYVKQRTGHLIRPELVQFKSSRRKNFLQYPIMLIEKLKILYYHSVLLLLPSAFRKQNVSYSSVGERHAWMYDFYSVKHLLCEIGYVDVIKMSASTSDIQNFPNYPLDVDEDGEPRKGSESMYIEAIKP